jgi:hypothetical protein
VREEDEEKKKKKPVNSPNVFFRGGSMCRVGDRQTLRRHNQFPFTRVIFTVIFSLSLPPLDSFHPSNPLVLHRPLFSFSTSLKERTLQALQDKFSRFYNIKFPLERKQKKIKEF